MKYDMVMPKMGESITEGTIIKWLKQVGDSVDKDEIILEISTDKVDSEIPTPVTGKIAEILAQEGETVEVGKTIAKIETETESSVAAETTAPSQQDKGIVKEDKTTSPASQIPSPSTAEHVSTPDVALEMPESKRFYSPVVLNIVRTEGISREELERIPGSGINGRITKKDVLEYLENRSRLSTSEIRSGVERSKPGLPPSVSEEIIDGTQVIPMDHIRKKIAEHMLQTVRTSPHVGLFIEVDMSNVVAIKEKNMHSFFQRQGIKLTYMPFISESVIKALKEHPYVNSSIDGDTIVIKHFINLGIAVASEQGLIVPVIKNADRMNLIGLARAIYDLADRTRTKKLKPDEVTGGTFSISNFGVYGTTIGFPLINQPQVAILGVGVLEKRVVAIADAISIRPMMNISLSFDHRLIDGALGAQFLQRVKQNLEGYDSNIML